MVLAEFQMYPTDKGESVSKYVSQVINEIDKSGIKYKDNPDSKIDTVASCLLTAAGERTDDPEKGTIGATYLFRNINDTNKNLIKHLVRTRLEESIPNIKVKSIDLRQEEVNGTNRLIGDVEYFDTEYFRIGKLSVELAKQ